MAINFIDSIRNFTIFLKFVDAQDDKSKVKKLSVSLSSVSELYDIAMERFRDELADSSIELYVEDKEFSVYCELEDVEQLYHGAIVGVHTKKKPNYINSVCSAFTEASAQSAIDQTAELNDIESNQSEQSNKSNQEQPTKIKNSQTPSYAEIVQNGSTSSSSSSSLSTLSTTINNSPNRTNCIKEIRMNENENENEAENENENENEDEDEYEYEYIYFEEKEFYDNYKIPLNKYYILLTGVPFNATNENIISFFNDLDIESIFFVINYQRNRIGHVFVVFNNKYDYNLSFEKDNEYIGDRYIKIQDGNLNEFKKCVKISKGINMSLFNDNNDSNSNDINDNDNDNDFIIKLKGFSFDINEIKIKEWLKKKLNIDYCDYTIYIIYDYRNRNSGLSFLRFKNEFYAKSIFELNHKYLGFRYIQVIQSQLNELKLSLAQMIGSPLPLNLNPYLNCLRMEGIPNYTKHKDILLYFNQIIGINVKQLFIKPSLGIAYIEFTSKIECQLALTRNETYIHFIHSKTRKKRKKYLIRLILCSKYELRSVVGNVLNQIQQNDNINKDTDIMDTGQTHENIDFSREFKNFHLHTKNKDNNKDKDKNNDRNNDNDKIVNKENKKFDWHLVSIRGIPFNAIKKDIINFFKGYDSMDPKSVRFIMDHKGRFSGQATVAFYDRHQARQAVHNLDRKFIGHRYVLLRLF